MSANGSTVLSRLLLLALGVALDGTGLGAATWDVATVADLDHADLNLQVGDIILIEPGVYPLDRTIQINVSGVTIRGSTGTREDVTLVGGGMNTHGVDEGITVGADDVTIRDLTVSQCYYNGLHTRAEDNVQRTLIHNVKTVDCGERHIKGSRDPTRQLVSSGMVIEDVLMVQDMERSGHTDTDPDYIGGIDMMCIDHIIIRNCEARNIHGQNNGGNAAIFLWNGVQDATITCNRIIGCAKGIALGNPATPGSFLATGAWHAVGGIISDNLILRGSWETGNNIGIELCSTNGVSVFDNTVYSDDATYFRTISISDSQPTVGLTVGLSLIGNLVRGRLMDFTSGSGWTASGNLIDGTGTTIEPVWFTDPVGADFHLTAAASAAIGAGTPLAAVPTDYDGAVRHAPGDIGALQYTAGTTSGSPTAASTTTGSVGGSTGTTGATGTTAGGASSTGTSTGATTTASATTSPTASPATSSNSGSSCGLGAGIGVLVVLAVLLGARPWRRGSGLLIAIAMLSCSTSAAWSQTDEAEANSYDAAWLAAWVSHCQGVYTSSGKSAGFVLQVGDSITHANPYSQWPRNGAGQTADDAAIISWMQATTQFSLTQTDATSTNGWYLAVADTSPNRGMTANSGMQTGEFLSGDGNGGAAMPASSLPATAAGYVADGTTYPDNLNATSMAAAFSTAQFAVLMLGTNDSLHGVSTSDFLANLSAIVDVLEAQHIVTILSTIPPNYDPTIDAVAVSYSQGIAGLAMNRGLPLIDFRSEILARQPGTSWNGTILTLNNVHPTAGGNGYTSASDPYADGGNPATHLTGAACINSGYLLRSWLTVQKMKQVKSGVVDHTLVIGTTVGSTTTGTGTTTGSTTASTTATGTTTVGTTATGSGTSATAISASGTTGSASGSSGPPTVNPTSSGSGSSCGIGTGISLLLVALVMANRLRSGGKVWSRSRT